MYSETLFYNYYTEFLYDNNHKQLTITLYKMWYNHNECTF